MNYRLILPATLVAGFLFSYCSRQQPSVTASGLDMERFTVVTPDGKSTSLYRLVSSTGMEACITNYGARIVSLVTPDRNGNPTDIVLGYDCIDDYINSDGNFGAIVGRFANRIGNARFQLGDSVYNVERNLPPHHLHGGNNGFHNRVWDALQPNDSTLTLTYLSVDGEAGFPGNLTVGVTYRLSGDTMSISYDAVTDRPTVVNLTNHSYFNLSGNYSTDILDNTLSINSSFYTPTDSTQLPTGEIATVDGTPLDFRTPAVIGSRIGSDYEQMVYANGYDHNYILDTEGNTAIAAATLSSPVTGIKMEIFTDRLALQFYSTNSMGDDVIGKKGQQCVKNGAVCLEPQGFPDSPNRPEFPSSVLLPGDRFTSVTRYVLSH